MASVVIPPILICGAVLVCVPKSYHRAPKGAEVGCQGGKGWIAWDFSEEMAGEKR